MSEDWIGGTLGAPAPQMGYRSVKIVALSGSEVESLGQARPNRCVRVQGRPYAAAGTLTDLAAPAVSDTVESAFDLYAQRYSEGDLQGVIIVRDAVLGGSEGRADRDA